MVVALALGLQGCGFYGAAVRELAFVDGWQPLPLGRWLLNDGIQPKALVICPAELCAAMSVVALFEAEGREALALERSLASDILLSQRKTRPEARTIGGKPVKKPDVAAKTRIERFRMDGMAVTRVALTPAGPGGNSAHAVVLTRRFGPTLKAVLAVTTNPDLALQQAKLAAKDW